MAGRLASPPELWGGGAVAMAGQKLRTRGLQRGAMVTVDRLRQISPAFRELSDSERQAITDFTFLWSLFEAKALNRHGSARAIAASAAQWDKNGQLTSETFRDELAYFRARYVDDGLFTYHFENLHLRANDMSDLVKKVLTGEDTSPSEIAAAVLIPYSPYDASFC